MSAKEPQVPAGEQPPNPLDNTPPVETKTGPAKGVSYLVQVLLGIAAMNSPWAILPSFVILIAFVLARRRLRWPGFATGILIGLGLLLLAGGLCAAIF